MILIQPGQNIKPSEIIVHSDLTLSDELFKNIDVNKNNKIPFESALDLFMNLNRKLGKNLDRDDSELFLYNRLDMNFDQEVDIFKFRKILENILSNSTPSDASYANMPSSQSIPKESSPQILSQMQNSKKELERIVTEIVHESISNSQHINPSIKNTPIIQPPQDITIIQPPQNIPIIQPPQNIPIQTFHTSSQFPSPLQSIQCISSFQQPEYMHQETSGSFAYMQPPIPHQIHSQIMMPQHYQSNTQQLSSEIIVPTNMNLFIQPDIDYLTGQYQCIPEISPNVYPYQNQYQSHTAYQGSMNKRDEIDEIFESIDRDHNGMISINEVQSIFLKMNSRLGRSYNEDDLRSFFSELDVNRDGQLSLIEFRESFRGFDCNKVNNQVLAAKPETIASDLLGNLFASIDINHDGYISYQEAVDMFKQMNKQLGRHYNQNDADAFFAKLDLNSDGRISYEEFREGFKRLL
jgi:Ca2+-binding EF-hand superfamily protein